MLDGAYVVVALVDAHGRPRARNVTFAATRERPDATRRRGGRGRRSRAGGRGADADWTIGAAMAMLRGDGADATRPPPAASALRRAAR